MCIQQPGIMYINFVHIQYYLNKLANFCLHSTLGTSSTLHYKPRDV